VGQIGFTSEANGSGSSCIIIQSAGKSIEIESGFNIRSVAVISLAGARMVVSNIAAANTDSRSCPNDPSAIARTGREASDMRRRRKASDKVSTPPEAALKSSSG